MKIFAVRHPSVLIPKGYCYGVSDVLLSDEAPVEMKQLAQVLSDIVFDAVYSSPLSRCLKLAQFLSGTQNVTIEGRLSEMDFGDWEFQPWDAIYHSELGKKWFSGYLHERCPHGGSFPQLQKAVESFLADLSQRPIQQVLLVTHAGIIRILMHLLDGIPLEQAFSLKIPYASLHSFNNYEPINLLQNE